MTARENSCLYIGKVRHRRFSPIENHFVYKLFMVYLDLEELPQAFSRRWFWSADSPNLAWFRRGDHIGDAKQPLQESVRDLVEERTGSRPDGPIRLLTHLRYFGYCFNPVSFYYCFNREDTEVETIIAEVSNTPWREMHCYVLPRDRSKARGPQMRFQFAKDFHVSPFLPMELDYDWRFNEPGRMLAVHMEDLKDGKKVFDATMTLERKPMTARSLAAVLVYYPFMTLQVVAKIHWQALKLWWKRARFYPHPKTREAPRS